MNVTFLSGREVERLEVQTLLQRKEERGPVSEQSGREVRERMRPLQWGLVQKGPDERLCSVSWSGNEESVAKEV